MSDLPIPPRLAGLPRSGAYVVPWFVEWIDGRPDFRVMSAEKFDRAACLHLCWLCGGAMGAHSTFVIGPMCAVNRVSAEPPSHHECAEYAARVCPFLTTPDRERRETHLPDGMRKPAGEMIERNPGVTLLWTSRRGWHRFAAPGGTLFHIGVPETIEWFAEGRPATSAEVVAAIDAGLPALQAIAAQDGPRALAQLATMLDAALELVPA